MHNYLVHAFRAPVGKIRFTLKFVLNYKIGPKYIDELNDDSTCFVLRPLDRMQPAEAQWNKSNAKI